MKKPCGCDEPNPELAANVRNAAALWVSAGKTAGFSEGVKYSIEAFRALMTAHMNELVKLDIMKGKELRKLHRQACDQMIVNFLGELEKQIGQRAKESEQLNLAATKMVEELERPRQPRKLIPRLIRGWRAFTE